MHITIELYDTVYSIETPQNDFTLQGFHEEILEPLLRSIWDPETVRDFYDMDGFTTAQCHTEDGQVYMTDQSGNGNHAKMVTNYDEVAELKADKERLDWLIDNAYIQFYKVDDGGEWEMELDASDARNHIDREMEENKA